MTHRRHWLRLIGLLAGATCLLIGPVSNQLFGVPAGPVFRFWRMYGGFGANVCDVRFTQHVEDGSSTAIDRIVMLGYESWGKAPFSLQRIPNKAGIDQTADALCERLPRDRAVYAVARCGHPRGWQPVYDGSQALCQGKR